MENKSSLYGVDVSKATLVIGQYQAQEFIAVSNTPERIAHWLSSIPKGSVIAMEATGAYHQILASLAHALGMWVYVLTPRALKHYAQAIGQRGKTDGVDSRMIARYVMHEQSKLTAWHPPTPESEKLAQLLQRRERLVTACQMVAQSLAGVSALKVQREELLGNFKRMIKNTELLMRAELARAAQLAQLHKRLSTIVGVGFVVAAQLVVALTQLRFTRADSFIAYTGLDPRPDDSGQRRGRRRLSKRGPALLRCRLYNAGMAATHSKLFKPLYLKLRERGLRSTEAIVILARKIARIAFALYRSGATFEARQYQQTA